MQDNFTRRSAFRGKFSGRFGKFTFKATLFILFMRVYKSIARK